jgi:hypothetical protein
VKVKGGVIVLPERAARDLVAELSRFLASKDRRTVRKRIQEGRLEPVRREAPETRPDGKAGNPLGT